VFWRSHFLPFSRVIFGLLAWIELSGCVHLPPPATADQIKSLQTALGRLGPEVDERDAATVATLAYDYPRELARNYRLVRPPLWHNLLINFGLKRRGLCYQWAEDLGGKLKSVEPISLEFHWGVSRPGSFWEHNTVVVTARHQAFNEGLVLDPWRRSGVLVWTAVTNDSYVWHEGAWTLPSE
jgi:hypothetical protein